MDEPDVVLSGVKCILFGIYLSHGCGHAQRKTFEVGGSHAELFHLQYADKLDTKIPA